MTEINVPDIVKSLSESEQVKNLANPTTKSIGQALGDLFDLCFGGFHEFVEKKRLTHAKNIEDFKKQLINDISDIPPENLTEPKTSVVGPALEASKYYYEEKEIRDLFERLIVRSIDNRSRSILHPSFTEIIKQLSPLDAQNLRLFKNNFVSLPICEYRVQEPNNNNYKTLLTNVFLENPDCQDLALQSVSLSSLNRLELIQIDYLTYMSDSTFYERFDKTPYYIEMSNTLQYTISKTAKIVIHKGKVGLTPLGSSFLEVCLSPLPNELNP